jgi:alpha-ketoglutarate-dependent taurine dioxygenase
MTIAAKALDAHGGLLIEAPETASLAQLERDWIIEQFKSAGLLLLRGFQPDDAQFYAFGRRFAARFLIDPMPGRVSQEVATELQTVAPGDQTLNLHYEYGITPFQPDVLWLYCARPARAGGATTVCDGIRIWQHLSAGTRELLERTRIEYTLTLPRQSWSGFFGVRELGAAARQRLAQMLAPIAGLEHRLDYRDTLTLHYRAAAIGPSKFTGRTAFLATILPGVYLDFPPARLDGGGEIPAALLQQILDASAELTIALAWQPGDVVMIDNTRWLHGRHAFRDPQRRVLSLCAYANFDPVSAAMKPLPIGRPVI